ncbi:hypothetical protein AaE_004983, partial [Aphanomyces astaci]
MHPVRLGSLDVLPSTTLAQARAIVDVNYFQECPQPFRFLYRGSPCPVAQEAFRCVAGAIRMDNPTLVVCSMESPSSIRSMPHPQRKVKAQRMVAHLMYIPIALAAEEKRIREDRERLEALARFPRPPTSISMFVQVTCLVDVPAVELSSFHIPNDRLWTVAQLFDEVAKQFECRVSSATHDVVVDGNILLHTVVAESSWDKCTLNFVHHRADIDVPCGAVFYVQQHSHIVVLRQRACANLPPPFDHWALTPGRKVYIPSSRDDMYTVTSTSITSKGVVSFLWIDLMLAPPIADPRLEWEVQGKLTSYVVRHQTKVRGRWFGKAMPVSDALCRLQTSDILPHVRALTVNWFVDFLYDTICTAFPLSYGITTVKFATFLKAYRLAASLHVVTPNECHVYFSRFLNGHDVLLKPQFRVALNDIAHQVLQST